jgi:hypothetical protein
MEREFVRILDTTPITRIREKYERRIHEIMDFARKRDWDSDFPAEGTPKRAILDQLCSIAFESMKNETAAYVVSEMKAQGCSHEDAEKLAEELRQYERGRISHCLRTRTAAQLRSENDPQQDGPQWDLQARDPLLRGARPAGSLQVECGPGSVSVGLGRVANNRRPDHSHGPWLFDEMRKPAIEALDRVQLTEPKHVQPTHLYEINHLTPQEIGTIPAAHHEGKATSSNARQTWMDASGDGSGSESQTQHCRKMGT